MDTNTYLGKIDRLERMVQNKLSEAYRFRVMAGSITACNDGEKVKTSPDQDRLGTTIAKVVDAENEAKELAEKYMKERSHIISQIDGMEEKDHYSVLFMYYVNGDTIEEIAKKLNYTSRSVFRIKNKALIEFEKKYGHEYKKL